MLPTLLANNDGIFQHDNAPTHTARIIRDLLQELGIEVMNWPPYSPDLNPIENLWALLKAEIMKIRPDLKTMNNNDSTWEILLESAQTAWENLDWNHFVHLAETKPHRVADIIKYDGWYTSY
jgi:transposase